MKFKTTIPEQGPDANPQMGARKVAGKSNDKDANLLGHDPGSRPAFSVKEAEEVKGAARKAIDNQVGQNGNPKKRDSSHWGTGQAADDDEDFLNGEKD